MRPKYGLRTLPKSYIEGLIFHCICNVIEPEFDNDVQCIDYALMQMLQVSPLKLRSFRVTRSAKYPGNLDYKDPANQLRLIRVFRHASIGGTLF